MEIGSDLSIVIVNWNVCKLLKRCLHSIMSNLQLPASNFQLPSSNLQPPTSNLQIEVIVVDNASSDGSVAMIEEQFPQVQLIANSENVGFTVGNNQGIAASRGRYILLLNPDTEIVGDALATMVAYMDKHPQVGALGPQLLNPDGSIQSSRRRFPTLATAFLESTILQQWFPHNHATRRYYITDRPDDEVQEVDWVTGACLLVRRETIEEVGLLDEGFFMYSEELDWCRRMKAQRWKVVYLPTAKVIHHGGQSSEQVKSFQHIQFQRSKIRYFRKHHGSWRAEVLRLFILATYLYQLIVEALKWLV
ncbi:MAG: glycosyltransferase family 2 protein, partial [Anaerolineales bacterium]|nr:glycosyltransferase family 2 protein [Anaerolineales bacterium]